MAVVSLLCIREKRAAHRAVGADRAGYGGALDAQLLLDLRRLGDVEAEDRSAERANGRRAQELTSSDIHGWPPCQVDGFVCILGMRLESVNAQVRASDRLTLGELEIASIAPGIR